MCQCCNKYQLGKLVAAFPQPKHYTAEPLIYHSWTSGCIAHAQFSILLGGFPVYMHRSNQGIIDLLLKLCYLCDDRWLFALFPFVCIGPFSRWPATDYISQKWASKLAAERIWRSARVHTQNISSYSSPTALHMCRRRWAFNHISRLAWLHHETIYSHPKEMSRSFRCHEKLLTF